MAHKSDIKFDKLYQKMYNTKLWVLAYQNIAAKPGNMTPGVDGKTIDGFGMETIKELVAELKESKYKPNPVSRTYIPKSNGGKRPIGIPMCHSYCTSYK
jgi:retron-type reverse transcriptase